MPTIHWPRLRRPDFSKLNFKKLDPRGGNRLPVLAALSIMLVVALVFGVSASTAPARMPADTGGSGAGIALPVVADPAPPPDKEEVPVTGTAAPESPLGVAGPQKVKPAAPATDTVKPKATAPAEPKLTKQDRAAIKLVEYWWDVIRLAYVNPDYKGTKLTKAQLKQPPIVIVKKASCKQPKSNLLGPKALESFTYCNGRIELVTKVFLSTSEFYKLRVVASGFIYHAMANMPDRLAAGRSKAMQLGCLQGSLAAALLLRETIHAESGEEAWVVISPTSSGEDLHNGYVGTLMDDGRWTK